MQHNRPLTADRLRVLLAEAREQRDIARDRCLTEWVTSCRLRVDSLVELLRLAEVREAVDLRPVPERG